MSDNEYLKLAIYYSRQSLDEGNFPAGAVVVSSAGELLLHGLLDSVLHIVTPLCTQYIDNDNQY